MKYLFFFFFSIFLLTVNAQLTDTTCIKSRWVSIKSNEQNKPLFSNLEDSSHVLFFIKQQIELGKSLERMSTYQYFNESSWHSIQYDRITEKEVESVETIFTDKSSNQFYIVPPRSTTPLANMYGEDSVAQDNLGNYYFVYPHRIMYFIDTKTISEIIIQEDRIFNEKTKTFTFLPVRIGFMNDSELDHNDLFWIDIEKLCNLLENNGFIIWSKFVKEKRYVGFQYAQKSCYEY